MIDLHGFLNTSQLRVKLKQPLYPWSGKDSIEVRDVGSTSCVAVNWRCLDDPGEEIFTPDFLQRNPLNIPGPFYAAETDTCLTGPDEAPRNVLVDKDGHEFVFKQPSNIAEIRDVLSAAAVECFVGYGADGDQHWRLSLIREWWRTRNDMFENVGEEYCETDHVEHWRQSLSGGAVDYLRIYAFFVEHGQVPAEKDQLPDIG